MWELALLFLIVCFIGVTWYMIVRNDAKRDAEYKDWFDSPERPWNVNKEGEENDTDA